MSRKSMYIRSIPWIILLLVSGFLFIKLQKSINQISQLKTDLAYLSSIQGDTSMHEGHLAILSNIFDQIDDELRGRSDRSLSEETINRISLVSDALLPRSYSYVEKDSLSRVELSRERGFLLKQLIAYNLTDDTFSKIKLRTTFSRAYLEKADLRGARLDGIQLTEAHLKGADLREAILDSADLRGANLWGALLQRISGRHARLNRADLRWANLDSADLGYAVLNGAKGTQMKMRNAKFSEAELRHANATGSLFNQTNFTGANLFGTNFSTANFSDSNLENVDFRSSNLSGTVFLNARMDSALFSFTGVDEQNWFEKLETWEVSGVPAIRKKHRIFRDSSGVTKFNVHPRDE